MERRKFIKRAGIAVAGVGLAASPYYISSSVMGANEKVKCGVIGVKGMGFANLQAFLRQKGTECIALCDVDSNELEKRVAETEKIQGKKPLAYGDYRKMLENKDIDVVIIATPDHWHCLQFVHAAQAGKDIYCEKPMANTIGEINIMTRAAEKHKTVVQIGQWQRSDPTGKMQLSLFIPENLARYALSEHGHTRDGWALCLSGLMDRFPRVLTMISGWGRHRRDLLILTVSISLFAGSGIMPGE
jgi:hypothetical protein